MLNGDFYPNGSYINHIYITPNRSSYISHLEFVLPNSTLCGVEWVNPNGQPVHFPTPNKKYRQPNNNNFFIYSYCYLVCREDQ